MLPFVSAVEPLRIANRLSGKELYHWLVFSRDGEPVMATNRMIQAADGSIDQIPRLHTLFVCGPHDPYPYRDRKVNTWLRDLAGRDTALRRDGYRQLSTSQGRFTQRLSLHHPLGKYGRFQSRISLIFYSPINYSSWIEPV